MNHVLVNHLIAIMNCLIVSTILKHGLVCYLIVIVIVIVNMICVIMIVNRMLIILKHGFRMLFDSDSDSEYDSCDKTDNNDNKEIINQLNNFITLRKSFLSYINKIEVLRSEIQDDICSDLPLLKYARVININELLDELLDYVLNMIYGENREKNEISNIDIDMNNDIDRYVSKYINIVNDKSELVNKIKELLGSFMLNIGRETS